MSLLSSVEPWNQVAEGYAKITMQMFKGYAERAIEIAELAPGNMVLDVACGPGTLTLLAADIVQSVRAVDFSVDMIKLLEQTIDENGLTNIQASRGDGQNLPYQDDIYDAAFSMFGLMFFPDRQKGYSEIYRTLKPNGKILISSWAPVSQSPAMQVMFGALRAMNPEIPTPQNDVESLENPDFFKDELIQSGFREVKIHPVTQSFPIVSIESFWSDMVEGSAPIVMMKNSMSLEEWKEKEQLALHFLEDTLPAIPTSLSSDAWIGYGIK